MNTGTPEGYPESFEPMLTAYLLGELDPVEAARVEAALASDPALRQLKSELEFTLGLVKEAVQNPVAASENAAQEQPQLSSKRREALLQTLRGAPVLELPKRRRESLRWMLPTAIAAAVVGALSLHQIDWMRTGVASNGVMSEATLGEALQTNSAQDNVRHWSYFSETEALVKQRQGGNADKLAADDYSFGGGATPAKEVDKAFASSTATDATRRRLKEQATPEALEEMNQGIPRQLYRKEALPRAQSVNRFAVLPGATPAQEPFGTNPEVPKLQKSEAAGVPMEPIAGDAPAPDALEANLYGNRPAAPANAPIAFDSLTRAYATESRATTPASPTASAASGPAPIATFDKAVSRDTVLGTSVAVRERGEGLVLGFVGETESKNRGGTARTTPLAAIKGKSRSQEGQGDALSLAIVQPSDAKDQFGADSRANRKLALGQLVELKQPSPLEDAPVASQAVPPPTPQPEVATQAQALSTFSLNVSDVSFKLAAASLANGQLPEAGTIRTEEFLNAFHYRDPDPAAGAPLAFAWDRAASPFSQNREFLRFSIRTAAIGREATRPVNLVLLLDKSGSMERRDRVAIVREALQVLGRQLRPEDRLSIITFARTAHLLLDGVPGSDAPGRLAEIGATTPEGGTNLEEAMKLAYATALRHFQTTGNNRVVLLTDGAANLGDVEPVSLQNFVDGQRQRGIALDCFGIGLEGLNDSLLATLSSHGDGRYGFLNSPAEAESSFAAQLAGALQVAASDVKVQVEFNPQRVATWRQIGYAAHQLTAQQFRDNRVDAAELAGAESGNGLYAIESLASGTGPVATVRARFREPSTGVYRELSWIVPYTGSAPRLGDAPPRMRLAVTAASFGEWLSQSPFAAEATPARLLPLLSGVPETFAPDPAPAILLNMIRQAQALAGR